VLANAKTTGRYPVEYLWYAGGVRAVMLELREMLDLECLTVTGKTLGDNLEGVERSSSFSETGGYLNNVKVLPREILRPRSDPFGPEGGIAVLRGNLAPRGAVVKYFSVPDEMHVHTGTVRVFDSEDTAVEALLARRIRPDEVLVIRYEGPRADGMPEMYFATAIIAADPALNTTTAVVTDGRFSGAAKGPAVGHVTPEPHDGGPTALVEEGDLIEINIPKRRLSLVGPGVEQTLVERRSRWRQPPRPHDPGILALFSRVASGSDTGASLRS
jgi:dihydroxy-acid dehydratase